MKFIHTADWHLGNTMLDIDRTRESQAFLEWLKQQVIETGAQALIIAGDIFDVVNPSNVAKNQYFDFLASLHGTCCKSVIVVGGNHDSGSLLDAPANVLIRQNVKVVGSINHRTIDDLIFEMKDDAGQVVGICCALPFMRDQEITEFLRVNDTAAVNENGNEGENPLKRIYSLVYDRALELRGDRQIPLIATGHLYAANLEGRNEVNSEGSIDDGVREVIGTLGNVSVDTFPDGFDYVALGHIHYSTKVAGNPKVRYSGSPFVMGFDEANHRRNILVVDTEGENGLNVEKIEVPRTSIRFEQFKGDLASLKTQLRNLEKELVANPIETYVDVLLTSGEFVNLNHELEPIESEAHFIVKRHRIGREILNNRATGFATDIEDIRQFDPEDYFRMLVASELEEDEKSEKVQNAYDKYSDLFAQALARAQEQN